MKKSAYAFVSVVALMAAQSVRAAPITYNFHGTVTQIGATPTAGISLGEDIPISFTVNPAAGSPISNPTGVGTVYGNMAGGPDLITAATFNGINVVGFFQYVTVAPGSTVVVGSGTPLTGFGSSLSLLGAKNGAVPTYAIPTSLNPGDFTSGTFTVVENTNIGQTFSGTIDGVGGINITPVPEPASWVVVGAGLAVVGWGSRRRRASSVA